MPTKPESADPSKRPRRRRVGTWLSLAGLLLVLLGAVMGWQAWSAYRNLDRAEALLASVRAATLQGDVRAGKRTLGKLQDETGAAREALGGPHWALAAALPFVGDDVGAVRTVSRGVDDLARGALPQLLVAAEAAYPRAGSLRGGRIDLDRVSAARPPLNKALTTLEAVDRRNGGIEPSTLTERVRRPVVRFVDTVTRAQRSTDAAATAAQLLPSMLGGDRPRTYLVLNQNTAEQRVLGGIPGSILLVRAVRGKVSLVDTFAAGDVRAFRRPVLPLTPAEETLHGTTLGQYFANVTDVPDFPRSAQLAQAMWEERFDTRVDGVLATDPYALQLILRAIGPVKVREGRTITGDNAARTLLNRTYFDFLDPTDQNVFFADAAKAVFDKMTSGVANPRALVQALSEAVDGGRLLVWSGHRDEENRLRGSRISGEWPAPGSPPRLGVFLHDRTQSKMSWYQRVDVEVTVPCGAQPGSTVRARVTVRSTAPRDVGRLPESVTGNGSRIKRGDMLTQVIVYAPPGWTIAGWRADDGDNRVTMVKSGQSYAATRDLRLRPGGSRTLEFDLRAPGSVDDMTVRTTPGTTPQNVNISVRRCKP